MKKAFKLLRPNAAGIDVASRIHYVAVPEDRAKEPVRNFGTFTEDLHCIAKWLIECKIDTVAMESTGIYWIQLFLILEEYGFEVFLVNARHVKNVSGRKSDVQDCQWIQQLHSFGLLNASYQPNSLTRELRSYLRHRKNLTESYSKEVLHMQKAFEQMNIKLHNVITDITGKTGQLIIKDILSGELSPEKLVQHVDPNVKASKEEIVKSLKGIWRKESLFELRQAYELYLIFKTKIQECDIQIENTLQKLEKESDNKLEKDIKRKVYTKNRLNFNGTQYLQNILGVDLTKIFGISELTALEIISEIGIDMTKWKTKKHFTSWLNLAPNNRVSGGKLLKPKKSKKKNKAGQAFLMAAFALQRSEHWLGQYYRRIKSRSGPLVATKATARKIATIFYEMITKKVEFSPIKTEVYHQKYKEQKLKYLRKQAAILGYQLSLT
ncbi:MAG: IS110 family transposase [Bacteroidales bacterium]